MLRLRTSAGELEVRAPARFLRGVFDWCDGIRTLDEIEHEAEARWGPTRFAAFLRDMLARGVLVDAARLLDSAFAAVQLPARLGRPAEEAEWEAERVRAHEDHANEALLTTLPSPRHGPLADLHERRSSCPGFGHGRLSPAQLSTLLQASLGVVRRREGVPPTLGRRTVPSAGAFNSLRLSLLVVHPIGDVEPGAYDVVFPAQGQVALRRTAGASPEWCRSLLDPHRWLQATGLLVVSADTSAAALKYRSRALHFALIEAGAVLQNGGLAAAESGVGFRVVGGYYASRLARLCALPAGQVLGCAAFGAPRSEAETRAQAGRKALRLHWGDDIAASPVRVAGAEVVDTPPPGIGWGRAEDASEACAIAISEAVERYSYATLGNDCIESTLTELPGAVAPSRLACYASSQYRRPALGVHPFLSDQRYLWAPATAWASGGRAWVPAECVYAAPVLPAAFSRRVLTRASSSGCATDARWEIALERAAHEVIERDALARHWLAQRPGTTIEPTSWPSDVAARAAALAAAGCTLSLRVLEHSLGPVILAHVESEVRGFASIGTACGSDPWATLRRALTEAEVIAAIRLRQERPPKMAATAVRQPLDHADLFAQRRHFRRARALVAATGSVSLAQLERRWPRSLAARLEAGQATDRLLWVDLTRADAPLGPTMQVLRTVRALILDAVPIGFGYDATPRGMAPPAATRFPHPLA